MQSYYPFLICVCPHSHVWPSGPLSGLTHNLIHVSWATVRTRMSKRHQHRLAAGPRRRRRRWPVRPHSSAGSRCSRASPSRSATTCASAPTSSPAPSRAPLPSPSLSPRPPASSSSTPPTSQSTEPPSVSGYVRADQTLEKKKKMLPSICPSLGAKYIISDAGPGPGFAGFGA